MTSCFSSSAALSAPSQPVAQAFLIRPSSENPDFFFVHLDGCPIESPPMYTIVVNKTKKPHITVSRGYLSQESIIGYITLHTFSSTTDILVRSQSIPMKESMGGNYSLSSPNFGQFKWKPNPLTGSSPELFDATNQRLAKLSSMGMKNMGQKKLETFVLCDEYFFDFVIVSAFAVRMNLKANKEIAFEITNAVLGA